MNMFNSFLDTLSNTSHLIILHHKLIWMLDGGELENQVEKIANGGAGSCFYCINPNNFYSEIYPHLIKIKKRGINVICIAGDIGFKLNEFENITNEGIVFLASGISAGKYDNKALIFDHNITEKKITWNYVLLNELLN